MAALVLCGVLLGFHGALALRITSKEHQRAIPNRLVFNYKVNLLENTERLPKHTANIKKIMEMYPDMKTEFLDDSGCYDAIKAVHSEELAEYFSKENFGPYKSDMCRLAQLAEKGGYYMDNDLEPVADMRKIIPAQAAFVTVKSTFDTTSGFFQAFLGVAPKHPVIMNALNLTAAAYQSGERARKEPIQMKVKSSKELSAEGIQSVSHAKSSRWLGPHSMQKAAESWYGGRVPLGLSKKDGEKGHLEQSYLLEESKVGTYNVARQNGVGCCCNFVVGDSASHQALFYSRFMGSSDFCNLPNAPSLGERP